MGGSVGITIRKASGEEHRLFGWTSHLDPFVNNVKLIECDEAHVDELLADEYIHKGELEPEGYGLMVVDYTTKTIFSRQIFTLLGHIHNAAVFLAEMDKGYRKDSAADIARYTALFQSGRVKELVRWDGLRKAAPDLIMEKFANERIENLSWEERYDYAVIDMSPWTIKTFSEGSQGLKQYKATLKELGFKLTQQEEAVWQEWIVEQEGYEREDAERNKDTQT